MSFENSRETNEKRESSEERLECIRAEKDQLVAFKEYLENLKEESPSGETTEQVEKVDNPEEIAEGEDDENPNQPVKKLVKRLEFRGKTR